ncbi:MAG: GNAT family N-acetyltransferase [Beijerinckiaceae bacterium]|nr:GNAT family N-acetyltransferase [Beijerinckiaceae bacterium]
MSHVPIRRSGSPPSIRLATPPDRDGLLAVAASVGLFGPEEFGEITSLVDRFLDGSSGAGHDWLIASQNGATVGVAYIGPERMTSGTANLYFIGIRPDWQGAGCGAALITEIERRRKAAGDRILLVETMGIDDFAYQRAFYRRCGFHEEARIREFYDAGADKIIFWKALAAITG